jgi:hypothetical protein
MKKNVDQQYTELAKLVEAIDIDKIKQNHTHEMVVHMTHENRSPTFDHQMLQNESLGVLARGTSTALGHQKNSSGSHNETSVRNTTRTAKGGELVHRDSSKSNGHTSIHHENSNSLGAKPPHPTHLRPISLLGKIEKLKSALPDNVPHVKQMAND